MKNKRVSLRKMSKDFAEAIGWLVIIYFLCFVAGGMIALATALFEVGRNLI